MTNKDKQRANLKKSFITPTQSTEDKEKDLEALLNRTSPPVSAPITVPEDTDEMEDETPIKEKHRVTLDLSKQLARKVKTEAAIRDQTLKSFIVELINRYFDDKEKK